MSTISLKEKTEEKPAEPVPTEAEGSETEGKEVVQPEESVKSAETETAATGKETEETGQPEGSSMRTLPPKEDRKALAEAPKKEKEKSEKKKQGLLERLSAIGTISNKEVVEFTRHLSVMLGAGVTIFEAILFLKDQSRNKVFKSRLESVIESLNNGQSLSNAMKRFPKVFPPIYTNIIQVGEKSGTLAQTMDDLANHMEDSEQFKRKVKGALIYPKIILGVMLTFIFVLVLFVMPRILTIFNSLGAEIPLATRVTIAITNFINDNLALLALGLVGIGFLIYLLFRNPKVQRWRDRVYLRMPLVGHIVLNYNTAQVSQHFGTLFASGITIVKCLEITGTVIRNKIFKEEIDYMIEKIKRGAALSQSFPEESYFPPMFVKLIRVGERTGKLPHVVDYTKNYYKGLVDYDVKNITTIIEPAIMVLLGMMVAGLVVTVIGPIYQLISNVGQQ